jgi:hypothetical protein
VDIGAVVDNEVFDFQCGSVLVKLNDVDPLLTFFMGVQLEYEVVKEYVPRAKLIDEYLFEYFLSLFVPNLKEVVSFVVIL